MTEKFLVGIDEVGRGPLAGPVAVGVAVVSFRDFKSKKVKDVLKIAKDSKKLSEKKREEIFKIVKSIESIKYCVSFESNKFIDKKGISFAIKSCIQKSLKDLKLQPKNCEIFLDGGLKAPKEFIKQTSIIKGDQKNKLISLASIVAKVTRDRYMKKLGNKYPKYGFEVHKGYGTRKHLEAVGKMGPSEIHRKTFLRNHLAVRSPSWKAGRQVRA